MKIIVTGATGLVGAEVLRLATNDPDIEQVTALSRRPSIIEHSKIKTVIHENYLDYSGLDETFSQNDVCIWCLGVSVSQVNKQQYHAITFDYTMAAAEAMLKANPSIHFIFLSGEGADPSEKSRLLFERIKGKTENALHQLPFQKFHIARPSGIRPINKNPRAPLLYQIFMPVYNIIGFFAPDKIISSVQVAKALIAIAKQGAKETIIDNVTLKQMSGV